MKRVLFTWLAMSLAGCTGLFFQPQKHHVLTPERLGLSYEDIYFKAADGITLHAWFLPAPGRALGTVLFLHGNAENISTHLGSVYWLPEKGFNVFLLDYRGYGASTGAPTLAGVHNDIEDALRVVLARPDVERERLVIFGQSLGGAVAIYAVAHTSYRQPIRALVVESAFSSYRDITREKLASFWLTWPLQWPLALTVSDDYSPIRVVKQVSPIPLLIIHGDQDQIIPVHHSRQLFDAAREPKELWIIAGGRHIQAFRQAAHRERLIAYLTRILSNGPDGARAGQGRAE